MKEKLFPTEWRFYESDDFLDDPEELDEEDFLKHYREQIAMRA